MVLKIEDRYKIKACIYPGQKAAGEDIEVESVNVLSYEPIRNTDIV